MIVRGLVLYGSLPYYPDLDDFRILIIFYNIISIIKVTNESRIGLELKKV